MLKVPASAALRHFRCARALVVVGAACKRRTPPAWVRQYRSELAVQSPLAPSSRQFAEKHGYSYEFVIIFPVEKDEDEVSDPSSLWDATSKSRAEAASLAKSGTGLSQSEIIRALQDAGIETET